MSAKSAAPTSGIVGNGRINTKGSAPIVSQRHDQCEPLPNAPPAELARRLAPRPVRRWTNCIECGQHIEVPARICPTCLGWQPLLRWVARIAGRS
jgi:hypothetical protein